MYPIDQSFLDGQGEDVVIANLGDSRVVLGTVSEDGDMVALQLTTDLKPGLPRKYFSFHIHMISTILGTHNWPKYRRSRKNKDVQGQGICTRE